MTSMGARLRGMVVPGPRARGRTGLALLAAIVVVALLVVLVVRRLTGGGYQLQLVFASAPDVVKGLNVQVDGLNAGHVTDLAAKDGQAVVTVSLDKAYDHIPEGSTASIEWQAVLGERVIEIHRSSSDSALPDHAMVRGEDRVEIDQVLAALDPATRAKLASTITSLDSAVKHRGDDLNATLEQLGPAVNSLSAVLGGLGADGPAIHDVVTRTSRLMRILDQRGADLRTSISSLDAQQSELSRNDTALSHALMELPATLDQAQRALGKVPGTVAAAHPLLGQLTTAVDQLPAFTRSVSPLLSDLNPTLVQTRQTLDHLSSLLGVTPQLLLSSTRLLPQLDTATNQLLPALSYLRPYTPEITGYFTNWASAGQQYLGQYHVGRIKGQEGTTTPIGTLTSPPPGVTRDATPAPGSNVDQPWTDATGGRIH